MAITHPRSMPRGPVALLATLLLCTGFTTLAGAGATPASAGSQRVAARTRCFPQTGFCLRGAFLDYWEDNGALPLNGYPLTDQRLETLEDGRVYTVQYFERVRLEYHPENVATARVLLAQFGRRLHGVDPPVGPSGDGTFYPETGHNIGGPFLAYWRGHGGLAQFGYPLSEAFRERLEDGKDYTVQYFERARFELHPENARPYDVLLGQFGRHILDGASASAIAACGAGALAVRTSADAGAGQRDATVALTNTGATVCALAGPPRVRLLDAAGRPLDVAVGADAEAPVDLVALPPGLMAEFGLRWGNWCGPDPGAATIQVSLPDSGGQLTAGGPGVPPCLGADRPSDLAVTAFRIDGAAGHANVILRYYAAINARDYHAAYALLSTALQAPQSYDAFVAGYAGTRGVTVTIGEVVGAGEPDMLRIAVRLIASQVDGSAHAFVGTYDVGVEGGSYRITGASIAPES